MLLGVVVFCLFYAYKDVILASKDPNSGGPAVVGFIIRNHSRYFNDARFSKTWVATHLKLN